MSKKQKVVWVGDQEEERKATQPIPRSSRQEGGLDSHWIEEGILFFTVRFMDGKCFSRHLQSLRRLGHRGFLGYVHG
jgi:hypothetical protein